MAKPDPISLRLTQDALDAIKECTELSGLERSAVVETAVRELLARLVTRSEKQASSKSLPPRKH